MSRTSLLPRPKRSRRWTFVRAYRASFRRLPSDRVRKLRRVTFYSASSRISTKRSWPRHAPSFPAAKPRSRKRSERSREHKSWFSVRRLRARLLTRRKLQPTSPPLMWKQHGLPSERQSPTSPIPRSVHPSAAISIGRCSPAATRLVLIQGRWRVWVTFSLPEDIFVSLRQQAADQGRSLEPEGLRLTLRLPNGSDYPHTGEVDYAASETDVRTGTIPVRLRFPNPDKVILPGQFLTLLD